MTLGYVEAVYRLTCPLTPTECHVLATLAAAANRGGSLYMRQKTIAARTRLHQDTVKTTLAALHAKGLIDKQRRYREDQSEAASMIIMRFEPLLLISEKEGAEPLWGGSTTPTPPLTKGVVDPGATGVVDPALEPSLRTKKPPKVPKGDVSPEAKAMAKALWDSAPIESRRRSGLADLERACNAALADRRADPEAIKAGMAAYYAGEEATKDGRSHVRGVHRMVQQDRWRSWAPEDGEDQPAPPKPAMGDGLAYVWRTRLERLTEINAWDRATYGPKPGEPGCRVPPEVLSAAGFAP